MAGEIDERGIARADLAFELDQCAAHGATPDIVRLDHLEAELAELLGDGVGVVHRLLQLRHVLIGIVADHQRDPLLGESLGRKRRNHDRNERGREKPPVAPPKLKPRKYAKPNPRGRHDDRTGNIYVTSHGKSDTARQP